MNGNRSIYVIASIMVVTIGVLLLSVLDLSLWGFSRQAIINCSEFSTQKEAQEIFNSDPRKYARLDGKDKDGIVCEELPI